MACHADGLRKEASSAMPGAFISCLFILAAYVLLSSHLDVSRYEVVGFDTAQWSTSRCKKRACNILINFKTPPFVFYLVAKNKLQQHISNGFQKLNLICHCNIIL